MSKKAARRLALTWLVAGTGFLATQAPPALAAPPQLYAGVTEQRAIELAKRDFVALALAFGSSPSDVAKLRRLMDNTKPRVSRSQCKGTKAWRILWPDSDPAFVNARGMLMKCFVTE